MKFEEAIKMNGKATINGDDFVYFNDEDILVSDKGIIQQMNKVYLDDCWETFDKTKIIKLGKK